MLSVSTPLFSQRLSICKSQVSDEISLADSTETQATFSTVSDRTSLDEVRSPLDICESVSLRTSFFTEDLTCEESVSEIDFELRYTRIEQFFNKEKIYIDGDNAPKKKKLTILKTCPTLERGSSFNLSRKPALGDTEVAKEVAMPSFLAKRHSTLNGVGLPSLSIQKSRSTINSNMFKLEKTK